MKPSRHDDPAFSLKPENLTPGRRVFPGVIFALLLLWCTGSAAWAQKINAAYINTQPAPLGSLTLSTAQLYGTTMFNRFNIMGLKFSSCKTANPLAWGGQPVLPANQQAVAVIQALDPNSDKKIYATLIGEGTSECLGSLSTSPIQPNASVCGPGGSGVGNINCAVYYLDQFMSAYGIDGLDIDMEVFDTGGFTNLLAGIKASSTFLSKYGLSFAPYVDGNTYSAVFVQGGACAFQDNGITNFVAGRQYYSGGSIGNPSTLKTDSISNYLSQELAPPQSVQCEKSGALKLDASKMVVGLSPYSVLGDQFPHIRGYPNTCQYYYQRGNPDCAAMIRDVVAKFPQIAGTFVWTLGLLDPVYYSCYIGNALNNTNYDCGEPQPIPGNAGYCGPTQPPNCKEPNAQNYPAGPLRNQQDASAKCPGVCAAVGLKWNGQWATTVPDKMSVCGCVPQT